MITSPVSRRIFRLFVAVHITVIALSNYLVQFPVSVFGFDAVWGTFSFPIIFLVTDLAVRLFGAHTARRIVYAALLPALVLSYIFTAAFFNGAFQGWQALGTWQIFALRIAGASFAAYACGQILDITVFHRLRRLRIWWIAPSVSNIVGSLIDTFVFYAAAFYMSSDMFMRDNWIAVAWFDYVVKLLVSLLLFVPAYGAALAAIKRRMPRI